ncbi:MAG: sensor histidine kinase [Bryobacterales bacterium]|nr:sensor histidine kinase [Bryobacterales bacterium]
MPVPTETPSLRRVLKIYSLLLFAGGGVLLFGPTPAHTYAPSTPYAGNTILRLVGVMFVAWACFARALAGVSSPAERNRGLLLFFFGQWVTALLLLAQYQAIFDGTLPTWPAALFLTCALLITLWRLQNRGTFAGHIAAAGLRSRYEDEIRRAAGQEERNRLARDLHDSIKQQIFAIQTSAATAQAAMGTAPEAAALAVEQVRGAARDAMTEMDAMLDQLRATPMGMSGLLAALQRLRETTAFRTGAAVDLVTAGLPSDEATLPPGTAQALLRVAQEALSNSARHARASHISIRLEGTSRDLSITIRDDGAGFDPSLPASGMGLRNMGARAAELGGAYQLETAHGAGTCVRIWVPLVSEREEAPRQNRFVLVVLALLAAVGLLWVSGERGGNSLQPVLMGAIVGAGTIFLGLYFRARRKGRRRVAEV